MDKLIVDGKVAVVYSPEHGAGWSTWNDESRECAEFLCMDKALAEAVVARDHTKAVEIAKARYPDVYTGGASTLEVAWVPQGTRFIVNEYDGSESVDVLEDISFHTA